MRLSLRQAELLDSLAKEAEQAKGEAVEGLKEGV